MPTYINEDVLSLPEQVQKNKEDIAANAAAIAEIDPDAITAVINQVGTNTTNIATNANDITNLQNGLGATNGLVTSINNRLTTAEGNITNLTTRVGTAEGNITNLTTRVGTAEGNIASEILTRSSLIYKDANGDTNIVSTAGKKIELLSQAGDLSMQSKIEINGEGNIILDNDGYRLKVTGSDVQYNDIQIANLWGIPLSNIVDAQGHKRFIEDAGDLNTITGVTFNYNKWSLSGTHLMIVLGGTIENGATINDGSILVSYNTTMPSWIINKINTLYLANVDNKKVEFYSDDWTTQTTVLYLRKLYDNTLGIYKQGGSYTADKNRTFRVQFDLLIDTE